MADVLALLREYHLNGRQVVESENEIIFGDFAWPKTTKTNFLVWGSGKDGTSKDYYGLDCIVYLLKHIDLPHTQYVRQAAVRFVIFGLFIKGAGVPVVRLPDRRDLLAYLKGESNTASSIDRAAPVDISLRRIVSKRPDNIPNIRGVDSGIQDAFALDLEAKRPRIISSGDSNSGISTKGLRVVDAISREQHRLPANHDALEKHMAPLTPSEQTKTSTLPDAVPLDKIQSWRAKFRALHQQRSKADDLITAGDQLASSLDVSACHPHLQQKQAQPPGLDSDSSVAAVSGSAGIASLLSLRSQPAAAVQSGGGEQQCIVNIDVNHNLTAALGSTEVVAAPASIRHSNSLVASDVAAVQSITSKERRWRTRLTVLQSQSKTFYENIVLGILRNVIIREDSHGSMDGKLQLRHSGMGPWASQMGSNVQASGAQFSSDFPQPLAVGASYANRQSAPNSSAYTTGSAMVLSSTGQQNMSVKPGDQKHAHQQQMHYSRYDQERFASGREETAGFRIDTMASYHGKALAVVVGGGGGGKAHGGTGDSIAPSTKASFRTTDWKRSAAASAGGDGGETPLPMYEPQTPRDPRQSGAGVPMTPSATPDTYRGLRSTADARLAARSKARSSRIPIIIIPAAPTSLITMYNARDILQDLRFVSSQDRQASGVKRENEILIHRRKSDGRSVPYRVVDQPNKLTPEEWNRVVAVFVQGQAWQFKGWPVGSDPAIIFSVLKGFHLKYTNMPLNGNVGKWNVRVISLDQRRHLDKANFQQIWDQLDKHIAKCKPFLRY